MTRVYLAAILIALVLLPAQTHAQQTFVDLWLTPDQQGRWAHESLDFSAAADSFADPMWKGVAAHAAGRYQEAAAAFARLPTAEGFFNRGNAFMKANVERHTFAQTNCKLCFSRRGRSHEALSCACHQRPRKNRRSSSVIDIAVQVGRP